MSQGFLSESNFLIQLAIHVFNAQYEQDLQISNCTIRSVSPQYSKTLGYEIITKRYDDFVRMKIFLDIGRGDMLGSFRLENDKLVGSGNLEDEVYVAVGTVSQTYIDQGLYRFRWIGPMSELDIRVLDSGGEPLQWMDGSLLEWESMV